MSSYRIEFTLTADGRSLPGISHLAGDNVTREAAREHVHRHFLDDGYPDDAVRIDSLTEVP